MSSLLGLLAEYGIWPRVMNAAAISSSIKVMLVLHTDNKFVTITFSRSYILFYCNDMEVCVSDGEFKHYFIRIYNC